MGNHKLIIKFFYIDDTFIFLMINHELYVQHKKQIFFKSVTNNTNFNLEFFSDDNHTFNR